MVGVSIAIVDHGLRSAAVGQHIAARHHYAASSRDHSMGHPHSDHWIARRAAGEKTRLKADR